MLVADVKKCNTYLNEIFGHKNMSRYIGRLTKKYADYFRDYEKKIKRYSDKEYKKAINDFKKQEQYCIGKKYKEHKEDILLLIKYKARVEVLLKLKNK